MRGVRGANKSPGAYRRIPNWIGPPGCDREEARFVPIAADQLPQAMAAWERYIHSEAPDRLAQLAILHAEFEALHPFLDGNGRLGRMLAPLFLWQAELIRAPVFYMSAHLEAHRNAYLFCLASPAWMSALISALMLRISTRRKPANPKTVVSEAPGRIQPASTDGETAMAIWGVARVPRRDGSPW